MKQILKTIFLLFAISQTLQAGRYYSSEEGRFISRDPLGYVDGHGLYNAYFAEKFGLDPSGTEFLFDGIEQKILVETNNQPIWGQTTSILEEAPNLVNDECRCFFMGDFKIRVNSWVLLTYQWDMSNPGNQGTTRVHLTRTKENIERTIIHEMKHVEAWRKFHDTWEPKFSEISKEYYAESSFCKDLLERYEKLIQEFKASHAKQLKEENEHKNFQGDRRTNVDLKTGDEVNAGFY